MVITGFGVLSGLMLRIRVWYFSVAPSMQRITSKTTREQPDFALRAEREAIQIMSHKRSCTT